MKLTGAAISVSCGMKVLQAAPGSLSLSLAAKGKQMADVAASGLFYAAPFASDGELIGVGQWRLADLSPRWLDFCRQFLADQGERFRTALPGPLSRLQLSFTSAEGAALVTFSVGGQMAASAVYLRG